MNTLEDKVKFELRDLIMPNFLYKEDRLSIIATKVYCFIHSYTNPFFFSNHHLAEMFNCHPETISTAIGQLEKLGYITTQYRVKANGGKIRLSVDAYSDSVSTLSREKKSEAPTKRPHLDKESKDNNIKGKILETNDLDSEEYKQEMQRMKPNRNRVPKLGFRSTFQIENPSPYKGSPPQYPRKTGTIAPEDLL